jgi:hypothetical protein
VGSFLERPLYQELVWLLGLLVLSGMPAVATSAERDVELEGIVESAFLSLYGEDYIQMMELETHPISGKGMTRKLQVIRKQSASPGKALVRFVDPPFLRKTAILIIENDSAFDDLYVYLPAARMTRHLRASQRADAFFGTDLSYEDVEPKRAEDYEVRRATSSDVGREDCEVVELVPREELSSAYEKLVACIERDPGSFHWIEFYRMGTVVKRLEIDRSSIRKIGRRHFPFVMSMRDLRKGSHTVISTESYEALTEIADDLFSTRNLEVGSARGDRARARSRE